MCITSLSVDATSLIRSSSFELFSLLYLPLFSCKVDRKLKTSVAVVGSVAVAVVALAVEVIVSLDVNGTSKNK